MNTQLLDRIASWLERGGNSDGRRFHIGVGHFNAPECRTACCIAGAAIEFGGLADVIVSDLYQFAASRRHPATLEPTMVSGKGVEGVERHWTVLRVQAAHALDIDLDTADKLFVPGRDGEFKKISAYNDPAWAARVIRKLIATGDVDWEGTRETSPAVKAIIAQATADLITEETHEPCTA